MSELSVEHAAVIEAYKGQLLIAFVRRLGGKVSVPVEEVNATGDANLTMRMEGEMFHFEVVDK